jgi:mannuronan 5-epimerase
MPDRFRPWPLTLKGALLAGALFGMSQAAWGWKGGEIQDLNADLAALAAEFAVLSGPGAPIALTRDAAGMVAIPAQDAIILQPAQTKVATTQSMNMRIALTMLSQSYGATDNSVVMAAQTQAEPKALAIVDGTLSLADLRAALAAQGLQEPTATDIQVPVIVMPGATLRLNAGDTLMLSRRHGAFVVNFGALVVDRATITASDEANATSRNFNPFVTTAQGGTVHMTGAYVTGLGFGKTVKFAGFGVALSALRHPGQGVVIDGSIFEDMRSVGLSGVDDAVIRGNLFRDMRGPALMLNRSHRADISGNVFTGPMATNAIAVDHGSTGAMINGNLVLGGQRNGIVVRHESHDPVITGNVVWDRTGGGITVAESDCGLVAENLIIANGQKGVEVRSSDGTSVTANRIYGNDSAALWVSAQEPGAVAIMADNVLAENGTGLAAASGAGVILRGNDFSDQTLRLLGGDFALQSPLIAGDMQGLTEVMLTAGGGTAVPQAPPDVCRR